MPASLTDMLASLTIESNQPIHIDFPDHTPDQNLTPPQRIIRFVNSISDILEELELNGFKKMLQITIRNAYEFQRIPIEEGGPSLADCINTLVHDYNSIKNTHPRVGYYYNAMCLEFLQRSLLVVGADPEYITELDNKINQEFNKFKGIFE